MEALLPEEALEDDFKSFDMAVRVLTLKDYDYLDFRNEAFDKDYVDFLTRMDSLTERLQVNSLVHLENQKYSSYISGTF